MCKKAGTAFPGEPGGVPSKDHNTRREQGSPCPLWVNEGWAPPGFFILFRCQTPLPCPRCNEQESRRGWGGQQGGLTLPLLPAVSPKTAF